MGKAAIRLPEKSYFSPAEIAERWGCPVEQVLHYLDDGALRPAIKTGDLKRGYLSPTWPMPEDAFDSTSRDDRFLYIPVDSVSREVVDGMMWCFSIYQVETFEGTTYWITEGGTGGLEAQSIDYMVVVRDHGDPPIWEWDRNNTIITREERDRFERDNGIVVDGQAATAEAAELQQEAPAGGLVFPYATRELEAMREAVRLYWEDYTPDKRLPTQKEIAYTLGELLGLPQQSNGDPARKAITLATAIRPDTLPDA